MSLFNMSNSKTALVLGASTKPHRYSNKAIRMLREYKIPVKAIAKRDGIVEDVAFDTSLVDYENIDTVTMYLSDKNQEDYEDYVISLKPNRIIFNPGAENPNLYKKAKEEGIEVINACTLVMLSTNQY